MKIKLIASCFITTLISTLAYSTDLEQNTHGDCSPAIANIVGDVSVICTDLNAQRAFVLLMEKVDRLNTFESEKNEIIKSQQRTIEILVTKANEHRGKSIFSTALLELSYGKVGAVQRVLDSELETFEKEVAKASELYRQKAIFWLENDDERAFKAFKRAFELNENDHVSGLELARFYNKNNNPDKAIQTYKLIIESGTLNSTAKIMAIENIGITYLNRGDIDKAILYFTLSNEEWEVEYEGFKKTFGDNVVPENLILNHFHLAKSYFLKKQYKEMDQILEEASFFLTNSNDIYFAWLSLDVCQLYMLSSKHDKCSKYLKYSLGVFYPKDEKLGLAYTLMWNGLVAQESQNFSVAIKSWEQALSFEEYFNDGIKAEDLKIWISRAREQVR